MAEALLNCKFNTDKPKEESIDSEPLKDKEEVTVINISFQQNNMITHHDIGLLNDLLDGSPCKKASLILNDYKKMLRDNVETRLEIPKEAPVNTEGRWLELKEERDHTEVTLKVLLKHKEHLIKHFGIPADVLTFSHAYKGCVTTCWYITSEAAAIAIKEKLLQNGGIEEGGTSLKEGDTSLKEGDSSLEEGDSSLKEGDPNFKEGDTSLKEGDTSLKDEFIIFKEKEMKEKQTLIDQVERLKQSEREYEPKVQELMERNTQWKVFRSDLLTAGGGHVLKPTEIPEMPIGINFGKALVHNQRVCVCGAQRGDQSVFVYKKQIVQIYDVKSNKWSTLPSSPYSHSGATIINDQLTLIGGEDTLTPISKLVTWTGEEWLELYPPMHTARSSPGVLTMGDLIIVSGGRGADGKEVDTIEFLNIKNKKWIQSNRKLPRPLSHHHMALCGDFIYIYYHYNGYFWRMNKKNFMASLTNNDVHHWEQLENAPVNSSLLQYSTLPVIVGPYGIFIFEKKEWTQISKEMSYDFNCTASLNGTTFLTIGGHGGQYETRTVQYDIAVEEEDTSLKEGDTSLKEGGTSLKEGDTSLKEGDTSLKEGDTSLKEGDTSLKEGDTSLKDEFIIFKEKEMKEKQTLIDQVERLKQSEREYELKVQELMERNTQLKTEVADLSSKGTETQQKIIGRLEEKIAELTRELRDTQKDNLHLKERNTDLMESNSQSTEKMAELTRELRDTQKDNLHLKERNTDFKLTESNSQSTEKIAELTRELRDTQKDNLHLKERNADLKESNIDLKESNIELKESISELKKTHSDLSSQTTEKMDELTRELRDTQRNVDKLECSKVHLEERINDFKKTNSLLEEGNSELKTRLQQQQQSTERVAELQEENIKLREEKSFLEGSLKETEERRKALKEEKDKTEKQAEELRSNMLGKVEGFGAMLEEMKKSLDVLEEKQSKGELMRTELKTRHMAVVQRTIIDEVPQKWKEIATYLEFELNKIEIIKAKKNDKEKCYEMLAEWLKYAKGSGELPRTLKSLHNALVDRDCRPEADKLVEEVKRMTK